MVRLGLLISGLCLVYNVFASQTHERADGALQHMPVQSQQATTQWRALSSSSEQPYQTYIETEHGFVVGNPANNWWIYYQHDGTTTLLPYAEHTGNYHIAMRLISIGDDASFASQAPLRTYSQGNQFNYDWSADVSEYWINSAASTEQWFELKQRPTLLKPDDTLTVVMQLDTSLSVAQQGNSLRLNNAAGVDISYSKLKVWDANKQLLTANMTLQGEQITLAIEDQHAVYPLTIDPSLEQQAFIKASNTGGADQFGFSVAMDADTLAVAAVQEDSAATGINGDQSDETAGNSGAVYVFVRSSDNIWTQQGYIKASNTGNGDGFGESLSLFGDTLVVGAPDEDSNANGVNGDQSNNEFANSGAAYVFVRDTSGVWSQQAYLKASNVQSGDIFGAAVAISADTLAVGAPNEESAATGIDGDQSDGSVDNAGAVYVFIRDNNDEWSQQAYIKASNTGRDDVFGTVLGLDQDTLVVGAPGEDSDSPGVDGDQTSNAAFAAGASYVFVRDGSDQWSQQAYIKASSPQSAAAFGNSVDVSADSILIGEPLRDDPPGVGTRDFGAAYVFVREQTTWSQQALLTASNAEADDEFGHAVAIEANTLIVSAVTEESNATGVNGDQTNNDAGNSGAAYTFTRDGSIWTQQKYLKASNTGNGDNFGMAVAMSVDTFALGAHLEDSSGVGVNPPEVGSASMNSGAVYVFAPPTFSIGGTVTGLAAGNSVSLQNNADNDLLVNANGNFSFAGMLDDGAAYSVTVSTQPDTPQQFCTVSNDNGVVMGADVTDVSVNCVTSTFTVGGTVSGLAAGNRVILRNNLSDPLAVNANGNFTFTTALDDGSDYSVSVSGQPTTPSQVCTVSNTSGTLAAANVTTVTVNCVTSSFTVGGNVTGLAAGNSVTLQNNTGDDLTVNANGGFTFATPLLDESAFSATVSTQPDTPQQLCTVTNGSGTLAGADVIDIAVNCVTSTFSIGGAVTGLATGNSVTLQNNLGDDLLVNANGGFTFATPLDDESNYSVSISAQPTTPSQVCTVSNASGTLAAANVTSVTVNCVTSNFTVGGTVTGLAAGNNITLQNNTSDNLTVNANGGFTFATPLIDESAYSVTASVQPDTPQQLCTVSNGSDALAGSDVTNVVVNCVTSTFTVGGTISGLATGNNVTLQNNLGDDLVVNANGDFSFLIPLDDESNYSVSVSSQPTTPTQVCTVSNASGTLAAANVSNVTVNCVTSTFSIGGTVTGLTTGNSVTLQNNAGDDLTVNANGGFTFATPLDDESAYSVTVSIQPDTPQQLCTVSNASGALAGSDVIDVAVNCVTSTFTIGGTVSGLAAGNSVALQNNLGDDLIVNANGGFTFSIPLDDESDYSVSVSTQPTTPTQVCTVNNASGTLSAADVTDVTVNCVTSTFSIGGAVTGLAADNSVTLQNNTGDDLIVNANGDFTFTTPLDDGSDYSVTVSAQPDTPQQLCTISNGSSTLAGSNVIDVVVNCVTSMFTIGGTVSGLAADNSVTLQNNLGDDLIVNANGDFTFSIPLDDESSYSVSVSTQPTTPTQVCTVNNASGTLAAANVTDVTVNCVTSTFSIGGAVTGLAVDNSVTLQNNAGDNLIVNANGDFTFTTSLDDGSDYSVTVSAQPDTPQQLCTVSNANGTLAGSDVIDVTVNCVTSTFTVGGMVSGLASGNSVTLQNNLGDDLVVNTNGDFTFTTPLDDESDYSVSVSSQPTTPTQVCTASNASGTLTAANVTDITVNCVTATFTIGGTLSGLEPGDSITLQNNASDDLVVNSNGSFTFAAALDDGSAYAVSILVAPNTPNQQCSVSNGSGTLSGSDINNVVIDCVIDQADLAISITDGQEQIVPGDPITYLITVNNNGPLDVIAAQVINNPPAQLSNIDWECIPIAGATCAEMGQGAIDELVDIPAGASLMFVITAATDAQFDGIITNTANVSVPLPLVDPNLNNNTASDITTANADLIFLDSFERDLQVLDALFQQLE